MNDLSDLIESEILLKMHYSQFIPLNCKIEKVDSDYIIKDILIKETKLFKFEACGNGLKIIIKESIYNTDEWIELSASNLTQVEKLMLVSLMLGNEYMEDKIPSSTLDNIKLPTKINICEPEDVTLTL